MSLKRTLVTRLPRAVGAAAVGLAFLGLGGVVVCSSYPTFKDRPLDCSVTDGYEFYSKATDSQGGDLTLDDFTGWFSSTDTTAGVATVSTVDPIPDGPVCKNTKAGLLYATHNNDWGCIFGSYQFGAGKNGQDASAWDGISFFARAPGNTTKAVTLSLTDDNSESVVGGRPDFDASSARCTNYINDAGPSTAGQTGGGATGIDPQTGTPLSGSATTRAPYPDECGNSYTTTLELTSDWQFYTVPFGDFQQASNPNRVPNDVFKAGTVPGTGLLTSGLRHLVFRAGKEAELQLWLANLAFYRKKAH